MSFSLTVPKKQGLMVPVYLHKGSWREFKIALALHLKGCVKHWDSQLTRKIFMILKGEEIRKRFLSAFPPLSRFEKLDLSLDEIINPLEILEKKSHRKGCHPGRLTLDPERYIQSWSDDRDGTPWQTSEPTPAHMRAGFLATPWGKHRLLDVSEDIENPHRKAFAKDVYKQRHLPWGLQDMYFLGGVPLEYWCNGDSMGMHVRSSLPSSETYQWRGTAFRAQTYKEKGDDGDFSCVTECGRTYCFSRMWYLPTEKAWREQAPLNERGRWFLEVHERVPQTWDGNTWWTNRAQAEMTGLRMVNGEEFCHNVYIKYIQKIEDFDEAVKCPNFGKGVRDSQLSNTPQGVTLWGSPELPPI